MDLAVVRSERQDVWLILESLDELNLDFKDWVIAVAPVTNHPPWGVKSSRNLEMMNILI